MILHKQKKTGSINSDSLTIYKEESLRVAKQSMCRWNRDIASPSCGSFDRTWWGWKARDFPDASLQAAITLLIHTAEYQGWSKLVQGLLFRYVNFMETIQHANGSFDQCYPNERTPGVFYDILPALLSVHSSSLLDASELDRVEKIIASGMKFALSVDERHGEISNHLAHFSYGLLLHWQRFGEPKSLARANSYIARILSNFDTEEGWFKEYHGPDAGYQTRTLAYLTKAAEILNDESLWDVCAKAAQFIEFMLMPDSSLHPMLGVRSTALIYPSGFERLAIRKPAFQSLVKKIRIAWSNHRVALPSQLDFDNALRLGEDAWHAYEVGARAPNVSEVSYDPVDQTEAPLVVTHLYRAGIFIRRTPSTITWFAWRLGGTLVIWNCLKDGSWKPAHEDAGYVVEGGSAGNWLTRMPNIGRLIEQHPDRLLVEVSFHRASHEELTPPKLLLLRLLNLTILRFQTTGDFFRKLLVGRLSGKNKSLPITFCREIRFNAGSIRVIDSFQGGVKLPNKLAKAPLLRCRRVTGLHMASARYFQEIEASFPSLWSELQNQNLEHDPTFSFEIPVKKA
jgi:hypothetical protein